MALPPAIPLGRFAAQHSEQRGRRQGGEAGAAARQAGAAEADSPTESVLTVDTGVTEDTSAAAQEEFVPEPDEETPFVPEEEEEGPATQGDHLMMAKAKMRRQRGWAPPALTRPPTPSRSRGSGRRVTSTGRSVNIFTICAGGRDREMAAQFTRGQGGAPTL